MPVVKTKSKEELKKLIANTGGKIVVYIWGSWCPACDPGRFQGTFARVTGAVFALADYDEVGREEEWFTGYAPTILLIQDGALKEKISGNDYESGNLRSAFLYRCPALTHARVAKLPHATQTASSTPSIPSG